MTKIRDLIEEFANKNINWLKILLQILGISTAIYIFASIFIIALDVFYYSREPNLITIIFEITINLAKIMLAITSLLYMRFQQNLTTKFEISTAALVCTGLWSFGNTLTEKQAIIAITYIAICSAGIVKLLNQMQSRTNFYAR
ncbi:hypothetical protein GCM10007875_27730 [Limnobacter litoralis]|uniref:Protein PsiE n=2 Tax=Limnobacter litoralis TaxID=481366 RepID=A0ABQ5YW20_9BURK|nr:hypothetical protein GCM10007875_27730 [Limnobacter litoralis]